MNATSYIELTMEIGEEALRSRLIAELSAMGYDGFEETDNQLKAYITQSAFLEADVDKILRQHAIICSKSILNEQNWNQVWESNFEPVQVDDFVGIRAAFHKPFTGVEHEIVITPKMSFGTGHHATTWLMMQLMRGLDFNEKTVFDFGTGTGILAILAEQLGAKRVRAVDNDAWCIDNALENSLVNGCKIVDIEKVSSAQNRQQFDIVLANINRNIILDNLHFITASLVPGGQLLLSGLLTDDEKDILVACEQSGLKPVVTRTRNGWIAMHLFRN